MAKTLKQLEAECNSTVKFILMQMEELAAAPPTQAAEPHSFNERRRQVVRKLWNLYSNLLTHAADAARPV